MKKQKNESEVRASVNTVVFGISFFITFFHLVYRLSEWAADTLLGFIGTLITLLSLPGITCSMK